MIHRIRICFTVVICFLISSCCNHDQIDAKIQKLESKRDSLLNVEETYTFQRLKDFEILQTFEDTTKSYNNLSKKISNSDKVSTERSALILKMERQIIELQKQKHQDD